MRDIGEALVARVPGTRGLQSWVRACRGKRPLAVILGGSVNGLSFARSLGRRQIPVLVLESERFATTYTRYARILRPPAIHSREDVWLEILEFVGAHQETPGVLFPTSDAFCLFVSRHREALARFFKFIVPSSGTLERIVDKRLQYEGARAAGVPIPQVYFPDSMSDLSALAGTLAYPCLLKPCRSYAARQVIPEKVVVVHSAAELTATYARLAGRLSLMVQEIVPGADDHLFGYLAFWDAAGREVAWVTKQKLRQFPPQFGDGALQRTVDAPGVRALSRRLLEAFGYQGFVGVEFKRDARDGGLRLMEINPRTVSGNQLAITAGVDLPWIGYQYLTGLERTEGAAAGFLSGVQFVNELWDLRACLLLRGSAATRLATWIRSVRTSEARALGAWDDPRPLLVAMGRFLGTLVTGRQSSVPRT